MKVDKGLFDGKPQPLASGGVGQDGDSSSSTTLSGISGGSITITDEEKQKALTGQDATTTIAALNRDVDSDTDTSNALERIFDEQTVQREIDAQVLIAQEFGKVAPKAVADFAESRVTALKEQAKEEQTPTQKQALLAQAKAYEEGGDNRTFLQALIGGLSGGVEGALSAGVVSKAAPLLTELQIQAQLALEQQGVSPNVANLITQGLSQVVASGIGSGIGGARGANTALAVDTNNRQLHQSELDKLRLASAQFQKVINSRKTAENKITLEEAQGRLIRQAQRNVDFVTLTTDGRKVDIDAARFIANNLPSSLTSGTTAAEFFDPTINLDVVRNNPDIFANAALNNQSGISPSVTSLDDVRIGFGQGVVNAPSGLVNGVLTIVDGLAALGQLLILQDIGEVNTGVTPKVPNVIEPENSDQQLGNVTSETLVGGPAVTTILSKLAKLSKVSVLNKLTGNKINTAEFEALIKADPLFNRLSDAEKVAAIETIRKLRVPDTIVVSGRTQSRVNVANGRTKTTPLRSSTNEPVSAGFIDHVIPSHFNRQVTRNTSVFSIKPSELKVILQSKIVVSSPVTAVKGGQFVRTVDVGKIIGTTNLKQGGLATSRIRVFTDEAGNLITAFPIK